jgi:hypothetical protein
VFVIGNENKLDVLCEGKEPTLGTGCVPGTVLHILYFKSSQQFNGIGTIVVPVS